MFTKSLYIQIRENRFDVRNIDDARTFQRRANPGFSHPRMLIGDFAAAQNSLKPLLAEARGSGLALAIHVLIHPVDTIEDGLAQVEERLLHELALGAGASKVRIWIGKPLTDTEAAAKLKER